MSIHFRFGLITIVDLTLADGNGLELTKDLIALNSDAKILVCSMHQELPYAERALRAGAKGYIHKSAAPATLLSAMRNILDGQLYLSPQLADRMLSRLSPNSDRESNSPLDGLSDRELEVFEEIGHGSTTKQIACKFDLSPKTIDTFRENLKQKLRLENSTELTQHAVRWTLENAGTQHVSSV